MLHANRRVGDEGRGRNMDAGVRDATDSGRRDPGRIEEGGRRDLEGRKEVSEPQRRVERGKHEVTEQRRHRPQ